MKFKEIYEHAEKEDFNWDNAPYSVVIYAIGNNDIEYPYKVGSSSSFFYEQAEYLESNTSSYFDMLEVSPETRLLVLDRVSEGKPCFVGIQYLGKDVHGHAMIATGISGSSPNRVVHIYEPTAGITIDVSEEDFVENGQFLLDESPVKISTLQA